jgi:hypothetical protein
MNGAKAREWVGVALLGPVMAVITVAYYWR